MSTKVPLSERALIARINRIFDAEGAGYRVHRCEPGSAAYKRLGRYYVLCGDVVTMSNISLEDLARRNGALRPHEELAVE
jgi:hypothetical protein